SVSVILVAAELLTCDAKAATANSAVARSASTQRRLLVNPFTTGPPSFVDRGDDVARGPTGAESRTTPLQRGPASLPLHRTRCTATRDVPLSHHQHDGGRHEGHDCRGHHCTPVGRIVAEIAVDPQRDRLDAGAVQDRQREDEVPPAGQEREDRDRYDG